MSKRRKQAETPLASDTLQLYGDIVEFNDYCAFFCEACSAIALQNDLVDSATAPA